MAQERYIWHVIINEFSDIQKHLSKSETALNQLNSDNNIGMRGKQKKKDIKTENRYDNSPLLCWIKHEQNFHLKVYF